MRALLSVEPLAIPLVTEISETKSTDEKVTHAIKRRKKEREKTNMSSFFL